jgi:hypothetical protein
MKTVLWNIKVSPDTNQSVLTYIATQGGRESDLSRFIEEAVRAYLLESVVAQAKSAATDVSDMQLIGWIDEALDWARKY